MGSEMCIRDSAKCYLVRFTFNGLHVVWRFLTSGHGKNRCDTDTNAQREAQTSCIAKLLKDLVNQRHSKLNP